MTLVHSSWRKEDPQRWQLEWAAHLPSPRGTHHCKMLLLFRRDKIMRVVVHTASLLPHGYDNVSQEVWTSPLLPLVARSKQRKLEQHMFGMGDRFQAGIWLSGFRITNLRASIQQHDFTAIHAASVSSTPAHWGITSFGWPGLESVLMQVPLEQPSTPLQGPPQIVVQVSSVATLGATLTSWQSFQEALACHANTASTTTFLAPNLSGRRPNPSL
ncbi:hypothetical protein NX059_012309 [Plenodomus lindquistii]|nr:hypothetical protein NX059_012309 [Plenodomus lindquistii]